MAIGPVQLLVIGFDRTDPVPGQIKREVVHLNGRGIIRVLEGLAIAKQPDGTVTLFGPVPPLGAEPEPGAGVIGALIGMSGSAVVAGGATDGGSEPVGAHHEWGLTRHDVAELITGLAPGSAAALVLVEHVWALKLHDAVQEVGGTLLALGLLTRDARRAAGAELPAIAEAEAALDLADALRGAALLDALEGQARASLRDAPAGDDAMTNPAAAARRALTAAETLRVLIVAGLVDDASALDGLDALAAAGLLDDASLGQAARLAEQQAVETDTALTAVEAWAQQSAEHGGR